MPLDDKILQRLLDNDALFSTLNLSKSRIKDRELQMLAAALEKNVTLTSLDLYHNQIGDIGAQALAASLEKNATLTLLHLSLNQIDATGAEAIAACLEKNTTLASLNLRSNRIGDAGAQALAACLEKNTTLTSLDLAGNRIGDTGAQALAAGLEKNTTLTSLDLRFNRIGDVGLQALVTGLEKNITLTELNLEANPVRDKETQKLIVNFLSRNKQFVTDFFSYVEQGKLNEVQLHLCKTKLALNCKNVSGLTAAHCAVSHGYFEMLTWLLANGANINVIDNQGNTPLHLAVQSKTLANNLSQQKAIVELLLMHGAKSDAKNARGQVALSDADKVKLGLANSTPSQSAMSITNPPLTPVQPVSNKIEIPEHLLCPLTQQILFDPVIAADGHTYEREAIQDWITKSDNKNTEEQISKLTVAPIDYLNLPADKYKPTSPMTNLPLDHNLLVPNYSIKGLVADFLDKHPVLRESDELYFTRQAISSVTQALVQAKAADLKLLLQLDKRIIKRYLHNDQTLLELACHQGNLETLEVILAAIPETMINAIHETQQDRCFQTLISTYGVAGGRLWSKVFKWSDKEFARLATSAIKEGSTALLERCLELGAPLDYQDKQGQTYLHIAASTGNKELVEKLLAHSIKATPINHAGHTPAQVAYKAGYDEIGKLIEYKHRERKFMPYILPLQEQIKQQSIIIQTLTKQYEALFKQVNSNQSQNTLTSESISPRQVNTISNS